MPNIGATVGPGVARRPACSIAIGFVLLLWAFAPGEGRAATPAGTVGGVAKDALERPLPGAQMRLETPDGQVVGRTTADDQGRFSFSDVAPGTYAVVGEKEGFETATAIVTVTGTEGTSAGLTLASKQALDLSVVAKRLEEARISIQPQVGASTYRLTDQAIQSEPRGENNPLNQVLLRAPGVSQDAISSGSLHIRNEHANIQYRIDGVPLPEGVSLFGQALSPRFASSVDVVTGTLPAQYGLRTAGIIDIQTKSGAFGEGGGAGMYGGSHAWLQPSAEYRGSVGRFNYFLTGDFLRNNIGLDSATPGSYPIHDHTNQGHGFGHMEYLIDSSSKVSLTLGGFLGHFQIPNRPGQMPAFQVNDTTFLDSLNLDETQRESNYFGVLSYLKSWDDLSFRVSAFSRYSSLRFTPDPVGDLIFNGIAQQARRNNFANGVQGEGSYKLPWNNTLRAGVIVSGERSNFEATSSVLPAMNGGTPFTIMQTGVMPFTIIQNLGKTAWTYSVYLQDEWRILPSLTLNFGGRFDVINAFTDENQISPRFNLVWVPIPGTTFHAGYAKYFSPPPFEAISTASVNAFTNTTAEPEVKLNSKVRAERDQYFDVGASQEIVPGFKIGVDAYYKWAQNLIDEGQFGAPIILTPFNYDHGRNVGVELSTSYTLGGLSAYGNIAVAQQKGKGITSAQFLFSSDDLNFIAGHYIHTDHDQLMTASAGVSYRWRDTRASVDLLAGSGLRTTVNTPNDATVPFHKQVNLALVQRFTVPVLGAFDARFDIINLLNETYIIRNGEGVGVFAPQFGPRRAFYGGLRKEF